MESVRTPPQRAIRVVVAPPASSGRRAPAHSSSNSDRSIIASRAGVAEPLAGWSAGLRGGGALSYLDCQDGTLARQQALRIERESGALKRRGLRRHRPLSASIAPVKASATSGRSLTRARA
jgi:hypothetical protein